MKSAALFPCCKCSNVGASETGHEVDPSGGRRRFYTCALCKTKFWTREAIIDYEVDKNYTPGRIEAGGTITVKSAKGEAGKPT